MIDTARQYIDAGISVIPILLNGSKSPAISWKEYQNRRPTNTELEDWFRSPRGFAVICGIVSGGLEVIDFDAGELFEPWRALVPGIVDRLPVVQTPTGGYHVYFRCLEISPNHKIAEDPAKSKRTLIETRGEGGYVVGAGNPVEVHPLRSPYVQISGPELPSIPLIEKRDRLRLWEAASSFDKAGIVDEYFEKLARQQYRERVRNQLAATDSIEPWADYDRRADWVGLLHGAGWKSRDGVHWTRPGKSEGVSATLRQAQSGDLVLVVFSSNAGVETKTYGAFGFLSATKFGGDRRAAAQAIIKEGYGR